MILLVAGGRDFTDEVRMKKEIWRLGREGVIPPTHALVCGMARGVDITAYNLFKEYHIPIYKYPADWNGPLGKGAGFARNVEMANHADQLIAFWDGKSRGTAHMIQTMKNLGKPVHIISY